MAHKSLTELAVRKRRRAIDERRSHPEFGEVLARPWEREASAIMELDAAPDVGVGGEVVNAQVAGLPMKQAHIRDTLREGPNRIAEDASLRRTDLLLQPSFDLLPLALDAAASINAGNSMEKMLAHQLALAHEATMRLMNRALSNETGDGQMPQRDSVEACRLANTAARLMTVYQDGLLTLQRLRSGGNQTVTVQHVNVQPGAQAVIGNVRTGGAKRRGINSEDG